MIRTISIQAYKSFNPNRTTVVDVHDGTDQPVLFFGLNGAGKSSIGEVIDGISRGDPRFDRCGVATTNGGPFRYMVYNQAFVDRVIGEPRGMPGIFTLGEVDTEVQREMDEAEVRLQGLAEQEASLGAAIEKTNLLISRNFETSKERVWEAHTNHVTDALTKEWLRGYHKDKVVFFNKLKSVQLAEGEAIETLEQLKLRWKDTESTEDAKGEISLGVLWTEAIETDPVWRERIIGSDDSRLAPFIERLGNADWVGTGRVYAHGDDCPFCQQKLPDDFKTELAKLLDGDRQDRINHIEGLVKQYETNLDRLKAAAEIAQKETFAVDDATFRPSWEALAARLDANLLVMKSKLAKPGEPVDVISSKSLSDEMDTATKRVNERITQFNARVSDRKAERGRIQSAFWKLLRHDRDEVFIAYEHNKKPLDEALVRDQNQLNNVQRSAGEVRVRLSELRKRRTGVDAAVDSINDRLKAIGVDSFSIGKKQGEDSLYCLLRSEQQEGDWESLSEGEKTIISFLYYVVLLSGSETENLEFPLERTIAVIDDPISSLSYNFVFDIASIIHHDLIKPPADAPKVRQVIVLTHNLFFLHELLKLNRRKATLKRVIKREFSSVEPMDADDLQNDYDALWQVMRDAKEGKVPRMVIPNTMRCILEHFFWFTQRQDDFAKALAAISDRDKNFKPLERFLNRGSHKDGINVAVMDYGQFDPVYYLAKFEEVFKETHFADHYAKWMHIQNPTGETAPAE
ncbi:AAA family ATPase [Burkholderia multivorans]|uniref:AAA family ATPase n=1 Tax=Burkholderia multivorans TaxID=87883 RepID=UPI001590B4AD|nr:AAA family ATPase [Burkholderia multivorans]